MHAAAFSGRHRQTLVTPQHAADARQQLARFKGLGHVVVRAQLQPHHAVCAFTQRAQKDNGDAPLLPHLTADHKAVLPGQHDIQHYKIRPVTAQNIHKRITVFGAAYLKAVLLQIAGQKVQDFPVVIHKTYGLSAFHISPACLFRMFSGVPEGTVSPRPGTFNGVARSSAPQSEVACLTEALHLHKFHSPRSLPCSEP